jgi:hypothetical protein
MVLASLGPLFTPPPSSSPPKTPIRSYSAQTSPRNGNPTLPLGSSSLVAHVPQYSPAPHAHSFVLGPAVINTHTHCPRQAAAAEEGGDGAQEARTGPRPTPTRSDTPATARLRRGRLLTALQPTKRQPATSGEVERGGRVMTARPTTTRAAPGCSPPPTYAH